MSKVHLGNAREPEQLRRMQELKRNGECHFCGDISTKHTSPIIFQNQHFFVVANDFPYKGAVHHYLIVSKRHIEQFSDLSQKTIIDLLKVVDWLKKETRVSGFSLFVRSGDMNLTGATLDHLHFHFLVGVKKPKNAKFPKNNLLVTLGYKEK